MTDHLILGVHITNRLKKAVEVQQLLTDFGKNIKIRLGLHDMESATSPSGLLILEMAGPQSRADLLQERLSAIEGVEVQRMFFSHE